MKIIRCGEQPSTFHTIDKSTGRVRSDSAFVAEAPSRLVMGTITFEPGARTNWHTHPLGQILLVTSGCGWTQCEGETKTEVRAGDVIWCPPNHKHWHGATATTAMTHVAIVEALDGVTAVWLEPVSDADYLSETVVK
jgi:quercetin dioxygenase-like cupin family protein